MWCKQIYIYMIRICGKAVIGLALLAIIITILNVIWEAVHTTDGCDYVVINI